MIDDLEKLSDFSSFILSLGSSASYYMGENDSGEVNIEVAKHTINTLEVLKIKTKNNLTEKEDRLLNDLLYRLRLSFISLKDKK